MRSMLDLSLMLVWNTWVELRPPTSKDFEAGVCLVASRGFPDQSYHARFTVPFAGDQRSEVTQTDRSPVVLL